MDTRIYRSSVSSVTKDSSMFSSTQKPTGNFSRVFKNMVLMWYEPISGTTGWRWSFKIIFVAKKHFLAVSGTSLDSSTSAEEKKNLQLVTFPFRHLVLTWPQDDRPVTLFFVH